MKIPNWLKPFKRVPVFRVKVIYKSGTTHEFDAYEFFWGGSSYKWKAASAQNKPIDFGGVAEIAAVWQVGVRFVWVRR